VAVTALVSGLTGCSGGSTKASSGSTSAAAPSSGGPVATSGTAGSATAGSGAGGGGVGGATANASTGSSRASSTPVPVKVIPPVRPACSMLDRATATRLLGISASGRAADVRRPSAGTRQLDGCVYAATGARFLEYLVWSTTGAGTTTPPPSLPANVPVVRFDPGAGTSSSGVMISAGGRTSVTVTAARAGRLVQITVTGPDPTTARQAATSAARLLVAAK
jgi:hypothetical protein